MKQQEEITIQSLEGNESIQIGYSDNDIVVVDSIQKFAEVKAAHVAMNAIVICTSGKVQARMYGMDIELCKKQIAIIPSNVMITDIMVSPDFDMKALFLTNTILQSFLHEKMSVWNDMMYIHRQHLISLEDDDLLFYTHFYDMLSIAIERRHGNPFRTEVIQTLLRSALLALCSYMKQLITLQDTHMLTHEEGLSTANAHHHTFSLTHFQGFLNLLHAEGVKHRTVESYASMLCITPRYLSSICKKHSGRTANDWIKERVLEDIRYYLLQTDYSVKEICNRIGFPNPSFFCKYVKEHFGMTPLEFRNTRNQ
jgi:AraC-like DNA-binding protein